MCEVVGDEDQLFKESYIHYYEGKLIHDEQDNAFLHMTYLNHADTDEKRPVNVFMGVDPASSTRQTADFSTIVPVAIDNEGNRFVLPYYRKRATPMGPTAASLIPSLPPGTFPAPATLPFLDSPQQPALAAESADYRTYLENDKQR